MNSSVCGTQTLSKGLEQFRRSTVGVEGLLAALRRRGRVRGGSKGGALSFQSPARERFPVAMTHRRGKLLEAHEEARSLNDLSTNKKDLLTDVFCVLHGLVGTIQTDVDTRGPHNVWKKT